MTTTDNKHIPVLLQESLDALAPAGRGTIVDCTLGGAGHTQAILDRYMSAKVLACDVDAHAIERARTKLAPYAHGGRVALHHGNFSSLVDLEPAVLPAGFGPPWNGVLMDLGYSSNQLESAAYGMSFAVDAPIDMRLSKPPVGQAAWELMRESSDQELGDVFKAYGEIKGAHWLARKTREALASGEIENSTASFAGFLERISGGRRKDTIHPATLVFQALRIAVNDELRALDHFLEGVILKMSSSGRIAIISFHSLEDRIVKTWGQRHSARLEPVTKKPIVASAEENKANPRARSAKLRVYAVR